MQTSIIHVETHEMNYMDYETLVNLKNTQCLTFHEKISLNQEIDCYQTVTEPMAWSLCLKGMQIFFVKNSHARITNVNVNVYHYPLILVLHIKYR